MNKLYKINWLKALFLMPLCTLLSQTVLAQAEIANYSEQDKHKAIIMCMTVEYVQFYQEHPAEEDAMEICHARFKRLTQDIPYEHYKKWVSETPYSPYPSLETSAILEQYNRIMLGLDQDTLLIN